MSCLSVCLSVCREEAARRRESGRRGGAGIPSTWLNMAAFIQRTQHGEDGRTDVQGRGPGRGP